MTPASDRRADDLGLARRAADLDPHRVRVHLAEVFFTELDLDAHLFRDADRLGDPRVVDREADRPAHQRKVGTVAAVGRCQRRVEMEVNANGVLVEDLARHAAQPCRPRGMRARRSDHHRPHDVQNAHLSIVPDGHAPVVYRFLRQARIPPCPIVP
jgi:hypothetical protein